MKVEIIIREDDGTIQQHFVLDIAPLLTEKNKSNGIKYIPVYKKSTNSEFNPSFGA
jgi:hypothetical protein